MVLRPRGDLDLAGVLPLRARWFALADDPAPELLMIDLAAVPFADATFVGLVVGLRRRQAEHGGAVRLCNPSANVLKLLRLTGLDALVDLGDPTDGASATAAARNVPRVVDLRVPRPGRRHVDLRVVEPLLGE